MQCSKEITIPVTVINMGRKFRGRAGSPSNIYLHTKWHLDASSRLSTIEIRRNWRGGLHPLFGKGLDPHLTQSLLG